MNKKPIKEERIEKSVYEYRKAKLNEILNNCLKDVDIDNMMVHNMDPDCKEFYFSGKNELSNKQINLLIIEIRMALKTLFENINNQKTVEVIDEAMFIFYEAIQSAYKYFAEELFSAYNCENELNESIEISEIISVKELLTKVYNIINAKQKELEEENNNKGQNKIDLSEFENEMKSYMITKYIDYISSTYEKGTPEYLDAFPTWRNLKFEDDFIEFLRLYQDAIEKLEKKEKKQVK